tara:strand:+ start:4195 stop:4866 length:672 start_codon:yes stop_codon:yes gene_type:complete
MISEYGLYNYPSNYERAYNLSRKFLKLSFKLITVLHHKMDKKKIEYLKNKRILLQNDIRLKTLRNRISSELNYLEEQNLAFNVIYGSEYINWINDNVKVRNKDGYYGIHGDFQIDVDDLAADADTKIVAVGDLLTVKPILVFFNRISNDTTLIICTLGGNPELEISKEAFLSNPSIFLSNMETWVLSSDKTFIIESISDQEVVRFIDITQPEPILRVKVMISS